MQRGKRYTNKKSDAPVSDEFSVFQGNNRNPKTTEMNKEGRLQMAQK